MYFVMYVNAQMVDSVLLTCNARVSRLMEEMKDKHKQLLKEAGTEPEFMIEHVPSYINSFRPLKES